jgi:hypothetical protein
MSDKFKTTTYTEIWYQDFNELVADKLGVEIQRPTDYPIKRDAFDLGRDLEMGQDTFAVFDPRDSDEALALGPEGTSLSRYYAARLFAEGHIPSEHPLLVTVWW